MSFSLAWNNLVTYSLQIGLLIALAAFVPSLLRLRLPGAKLAYWHILLATCLLLPMIRPWRQQVVTGFIEVTMTDVTPVAQPLPPAPKMSRSEIALLVLAAGALIRLGWLGVGFWRLSGYRRRSQPVTVAARWLGAADIRLSDEVTSPVTFGLSNPVVLLPSRFPDLSPSIQDAILCHELLHVERKDWLFTLTEELVRAIFWFHPAIWWLLGEIQLAREQAVDRRVIELTQARDEYVDALLAIAGAATQPDLAPAPLFLRKRHLKHRVVSILKEAHMSKTRILSALAAGVGILAGACWLITATFPLAAAPQAGNDSSGVVVDTHGLNILHRSPVYYPVALREKGIQGDVVVEAKIDSTGNVSDAHVLSGPEELRKTALQSVLQWHFGRELAGTSQQVTIGFHNNPNEPMPVNGRTVATISGTAQPAQGMQTLQQQRMEALIAQLKELQSRGSQNTADFQKQTLALQQQIEALNKLQETARNWQATLREVSVVGLPNSARDELLAKLNLHPGETLNMESLGRIQQLVREYDEHLMVRNSTSNGETTLYITAPNAPPPPAPNGAPAAPNRINVGGNVQQAMLLSQPRPVYPAAAKEARVQGTVSLQAIIGKDGTVLDLQVLSGDPLLIPSAIDAVRQWVYKPTLLNGQPVEVKTVIDVNYTLSQ